jgi:hypothetical protein
MFLYYWALVEPTTAPNVFRTVLPFWCPDLGNEMLLEEDYSYLEAQKMYTMPEFGRLSRIMLLM